MIGEVGMPMRNSCILRLLPAATLSLLAVAGADPLIVNDQATGAEVIEIDGRRYVPLDVLSEAGMIVTTGDDGVSLRFGPPISGGAEQVEAIEACRGSMLFNGVWRFGVNDVERHEQRTIRGWDVHVEVRNGSDVTLAPNDFGFDPNHRGVALVLASGRVLTMGLGYVGQIQSQLAFRELPPGAAATAVFRFLDDGDDSEPVRLVVPIGPERRTFRAEGLEFATEAPSYRIVLDCD